MNFLQKLGRSKPAYKIHGKVAPGFERVKDAFQYQYDKGFDQHSQLCVYHGDEKIVDLYGVTPSTTKGTYDADSLQIICSNGKTQSSIVFSMLRAKGLLNYEDKIAQHWPEFAQHGKEDITIADVMRHEARLNLLGERIKLDWTLPEQIKQNKIGVVIERTKPANLPYGVKRAYHTHSKDQILNEIFRRVEPNGRTMGEYWREEMQENLGADIYFNMTDDELSRIHDTALVSWYRQFKDSYKVDMKSTEIGDNYAMATPGHIFKTMQNAKKQNAYEKQQAATEMREMDGDFFKLVNHRLLRKGESGSANNHASARGMARLAAFMANGGSMDGKTLMSKDLWQEFHSEPKTEQEWPVGVITSFTKGGICRFDMSKDHPKNEQIEDPEIVDHYQAMSHSNRIGWYGWAGMGGSAMQWHPEQKLAFGYATTNLYFIDIFNTRASAMQKSVVDALTEK